MRSTYGLMLLLFACGSKDVGKASSGSSVAGPSASGSTSVSSTVSAPSAAPSSITPPVSGSCAGLEIGVCARTKGCIVEQPTYDKPACRAANNPCEAAVRHADLIGKSADPAVTPEIEKAARAACGAVQNQGGGKVCVATQGNCSCACSLFADCDCDCGGHYLPRCVYYFDAKVFDGLPGTGGRGDLDELGRAIGAVRMATGGERFDVRPQPPVAGLVGLSRQVIEGQLGTADRCEAPFGAPCQTKDQALYHLFYLPDGWVGGGASVVMTFDDKDVCSKAEIKHSR